ncbi:hypothetical protein LCGC14_0328070 [marine sediment metagenome]|uniref:Uncharacterized protein n=1 Tax=marine sediment metagenome TaxID=412755 RepID=A0A0F9WPE9_9ZZZZ
MIYVSSNLQLDSLISEGVKEPICLGGELCFFTHSKEAIDDLDEMDSEEYVVQPKRKAAKGRGKGHLYVAIDKQAVSVVNQYQGLVSVSVDQYLAYGLAQKENTIIIGGGINTSSSQVYLEVLVFTGFALQATYEKHSDFNGMMVDLMLKEIVDAYPDHLIQWCDPLPEPPLCDLVELPQFSMAGRVVQNSSIKRKIFSKKQGVEESWEPLAGVMLSLGGLAIFTGVLAWAWFGLQNERDIYYRDVAGFEDTYQNSTQSLDLLRYRDFLLGEDNSNRKVIDMLDTLLGRVSMLDGVVIHNIQVFGLDADKAAQIQTQGGMQSVGDFVVEVSLPQVNDSARVQGEYVIRGLSESSGFDFRLVSHREEVIASNDIERDYWRYQLMGSKPHAN